MRVKVMLLTAAIVFAIAAVYCTFGVSLTNDALMESTEAELTFACSIAEDLVSTHIDLVKADARDVVSDILNADGAGGLDEILDQNMQQFPYFLGLTIFSRGAVLAQRGELPAPVEFLGGKYMGSAFNGESVISTTAVDAATGKLVMYVCIPVDEGRAVAATISGMTFTDLLSKFTLWKTGNIFMVDEEGVIVANFRRELVSGRVNYLANPGEAGAFKNITEFYERALSEESGAGRYFYEGQERLCAFKRVSSSANGWPIGVVAPLSEGPAARVRGVFFIAAIALFVVGAALAAVFSKSVASPYYKIEEQNRSLEELSGAAQAANEAKSAFLANMSHEMRTPLNAIIGLSELALDDEGVAGEAEEQIEKVHAAGTTLLSIVNDILDISKIESGKMELAPVDYDTASVINNTVTANILRVGDKPIEFVIRLDETLPSRLIGDDIRVKQVFSNIISNAIKYTYEGKVEWRLSHERDGDTVWIISEVRDTGIGIKKEDLDNIFADYTQVDMSSHRKIEGTGLGLSITKRLTDLMGGSITAESEYGKGSVFITRIKQGFVTETPIGKTVAENICNYKYADTKRERNAQFARIPMPYARVLVVDDVQTNLDVARGMLKPYKIKVECSLSGADAVERVALGHRYDAILMDHMMPGMDGVETVKRIRDIGTDYAKNVPIIALTANAIVGSDKMFLENGFQGFLSKPVDVKLLDKALNRWLRDKSKEAQGAEAAAPPPGPPAGGLPGSFRVDGIDAEAGLAKFMGDADTYMDVLRSYAKSTPPLILLLDELYEDGHWADYAIAAHGVKGASYGVCAAAAGDAAKELEFAGKGADTVTLAQKHAPFTEMMRRLIWDLDEAIAAFDGASQKPEAQEPDGAVMEELSAACAAYDMDGVDGAMKKLEAYKYKTGQDMVVWLREQVDAMNFSAIENKIRG